MTPKTKNRYEKMTDADFDRILADIVSETPMGELLNLPGAYEIFSEHFNNEVLDRWEKENPEIHVYDNGLDYWVTIGQDVYEMNSNANMPNGVCIYIGDVDDEPGEFLHPEIPLDQAPEGLQRQVEKIVKADSQEVK